MLQIGLRHGTTTISLILWSFGFKNPPQTFDLLFASLPTKLSNYYKFLRKLVLCSQIDFHLSQSQPLIYSYFFGKIELSTCIQLHIFTRSTRRIIFKIIGCFHWRIFLWMYLILKISPWTFLSIIQSRKMSVCSFVCLQKGFRQPLNR